MTPEQLKTLRRMLLFATPDETYALIAAIEMIEKLPVDAEGNTVVLGGRQDVWIVVTEEGSSHFAEPDQWADPGIYKYEAVRNDQGMWCLWSDGAIDCDYWDGPVYSTREAAEAAARQEERQ